MKNITGSSSLGSSEAAKAPYHHGDLRAHLIQTVQQLVEEKGADGFSISEAARRAGVSSAAPYKHFQDKTQIVSAVALDGIHRMGQAMDAAAQGASAHNFGKVNAIGQAYVDFARAQPGVFRLMFGLTESHVGNPVFKEAGDATYAVLIREVKAAMATSTSEQEVQRRSYMLWTFVHGHSFLQIDGKVDHAQIMESEEAILKDLSRRILSD